MSRALQILHDELTQELEARVPVEAKVQRLRRWLSTLQQSSVKSLYCWPTLIVCVILSVGLLVAYGFSENK